jgi:hypothetical protein
MFINDTLPEEKARELRAHITPVAWSLEETNGD